MIFFFYITIKYIKNIVESRNKKMWSVSYVTCVDITNSIINVLIMRCADPKT